MSDVETATEAVIAPVPRITMQAFCESPEIAGALEAASGDRRMQKAHVRVQMGGGAAALEAFRHAPTPNVVAIEFTGDRTLVLDCLDQLAAVCDAGTKVLVVGHVNDIVLYREMIKRGVSDYLIAPVSVMDLVRATSELFTSPGAEPLGRTVAVVGAKGGTGASSVAHNVAWSISRNLRAQTVLVDLDIAFGTAGLDFNQDPPQSISDAIFAPERLDANLVDRLLTRCSDHLTLLAAPAVLDRMIDLGETALDGLIDVLKASVPTIVLDVPHVWAAWSRRVLVSADEVVIVASPDLASLRNAKNLFDNLQAARPNDTRPRIVLNGVGLPKRPEIAAAEFSKALGTDLACVIPHDAALFGTAANNGQMIAEVQAASKHAELFGALGSSLTGRMEPKRARPRLLVPLMAKLARRKAS